ncbi:hypothetical protein Acsp04_62840 [Actinomadura sp. NBRC 104425]|uniref:DUF397 domain-containing protein n=1 Tax=Actinomadura sp. NBRC 104425 TaxID=3032204 RepID=UPI0024A5B210|nr:DUF397 domain-containing protein [Actinomadura sp. NBRC 104425]GLZ16049.1 hypothetical protein Acsp04_62840 [Actinomadura sp. NBRC 104425]
MADHFNGVWNDGPRWRKSSHSGSPDKAGDVTCVEIARLGSARGLRDSTQHGRGPVLALSRADFTALIDRAKLGDLDLPAA